MLIAIAALTLAGCGAPPIAAKIHDHPTATTSSTRSSTTSSPTTTSLRPIYVLQPNVVAHLGESVNLTDTLSWTPPVKASLRVALDQVIDPDLSPPSSKGVGTATIAGDRWVELEFTVTNTGETLPSFAADDGVEYSLELVTSLDPETVLDQYGDPWYEANVSLPIPLATSTTMSGSSPFDIPQGLDVTAASVSMRWATGSGGDEGEIAEWLVP